jgi:hypothetical protein
MWHARRFLLNPASFEKSGIGGVLLDVGGIALFSRILNILVPLRGILVGLGIIPGPFGAAIGGRYRRHFIVAGH